MNHVNQELIVHAVNYTFKITWAF